MAETEVDILGDAVAGTEAEIFNEGVGGIGTEVEPGQEPDRSLEAMEEVGETEPEADGEEDGDAEPGEDAVAEEGDKPADENRDKETGRFKAKDEKPEAEEQPQDGKPRKGDPQVPLAAERSRRQVLEAELEKERKDRATERETFQQRFAQMEGRLDQILRQQTEKPKAEQPEKTAVPPDKFSDPDGYDKWIQDRIAEARVAGEASARDAIFNLSMANAKDSHGEKFDVAYKALTSLDPQNPAHRAIVHNIRTSPNPGAQLMKWHRQQETLQKVGEDPDAFLEQEFERRMTEKMKDPEFRKKTLANWQAEARGDSATNSGRPRTIIRTPPSLNGAAGRGEQQLDPRVYDNSEKAVFESAFDG